MALKSQEQKALLAMMNCRTLNSYVSSALMGWNKQSDISASIPRVFGSLVESKEASAAGTSSFGMSGTNAHMLISVAFTPNESIVKSCSWSKRRLEFFHAHLILSSTINITTNKLINQREVNQSLKQYTMFDEQVMARTTTIPYHC
jgi:hypothetical protein